MHIKFVSIFEINCNNPKPITMFPINDLILYIIQSINNISNILKIRKKRKKRKKKKGKDKKKSAGRIEKVSGKQGLEKSVVAMTRGYTERVRGRKRSGSGSRCKVCAQVGGKFDVYHSSQLSLITRPCLFTYVYLHYA